MRVTPSTTSELKSELRRSLIAKRRSLPAASRRSATRRAIQRIKRLPQFKCGARIAVYAAFGSELDLVELISSALSRGVRLYVPQVIHLARRRMLFIPIGSRSNTTAAAKFRRRPASNLASPGAQRRGAIAARWLDLIIVPILGIDAAGHRLGMGAGFFDRTLGYRRLRARWRGPLTVAIGFDCQRVTEIGAEPWDARLDALATELRLEHFRRGQP